MAECCEPGCTREVLCPVHEALQATEKSLIKAHERIKALEEALEFYADPDTYFAIAIIPDPPCGAFWEDFSEDHGDPFYSRAMPGKLAREVLGDD